MLLLNPQNINTCLLIIENRMSTPLQFLMNTFIFFHEVKTNSLNLNTDKNFHHDLKCRILFHIKNHKKYGEE